MANSTFDINQWLEKIGFGRFHVLALLVIGLRPFSFASSSGFLIILEPYLRCQWHLRYFTAAWLALPEAITNIAGSIILGRLSDRFGRRKIMLLALTFNSYLTLLYLLSSNMLLMSVIRAIIGFVSSSVMIAFTYIMEILPLSKRKYMSLFEFAFCAGSGYSILASMVSLENLTWRWFGVFAETIPIALAAFAVGFLPESPRYLLSSGRADEAKGILQRIAKINAIDGGYKPLLQIDSGESDTIVSDDGNSNQKRNLSNIEIVKRIALVSFLQFYGNLLAGTMRFGSMQFGENSDLSGCGMCSKGLAYKYRWAMVFAALCSSFPTYWLLNKITRKMSFIMYFIYIAGSLVPFYWNIRGWPLVLATVLFSISFCSMNIVIFVYRAELLPTSIRAFGCGISEAFGQIGLVFGQFIAVYVYHKSTYLSFGILHGFTAIGFLAVITIFIETKHEQLK